MKGQNLNFAQKTTNGQLLFQLSSVMRIQSNFLMVPNRSYG